MCYISFTTIENNNLFQNGFPNGLFIVVSRCRVMPGVCGFWVSEI